MFPKPTKNGRQTFTTHISAAATTAAAAEAAAAKLAMSTTRLKFTVELILFLDMKRNVALQPVPL